MSDPISPSTVTSPPTYPTIDPPPPKPVASSTTATVLLDAAIGTMKPCNAAVAAFATMFGPSAAKANVDAFFAAANPTLVLMDAAGKTETISVPLPFRMSTNEPSPAEAKKLIEFELGPTTAKKLGPAIDAVVWGRGTPEQAAQVAQALLDVAGVPTSGSDAKKVQTYLEQFGVGIDCAGYAQQAAMKAVGLDPTKAADRVKFGFAPYIGNESMSGVATSSKFTKVAPEDAKPGDVVSLGPPSYENVGHSLVVASNRDVSAKQREALLATNVAKSNGEGTAFLTNAGKLHAIEVDSSWGGKVGVARVTWLYDEGSKKWATLDTNTGLVFPSPGGPYNHPLKGFFHSKLAP